MSNNAKLTGLSINSLPADDTDAISYAQLRGALTPYLHLSGGTMTGSIDMGGHVIYNTQLDNTTLRNDDWLTNVKFVKK